MRNQSTNTALAASRHQAKRTQSLVTTFIVNVKIQAWWAIAPFVLINSCLGIFTSSCYADDTTASVEQAKEKAATSGLMAFKDDLADMLNSFEISDLTNQVLIKGENRVAKVEYSIIASKAALRSGGINTTTLSNDTGGSELPGHKITQVTNLGATIGTTKMDSPILSMETKVEKYGMVQLR